MEPLSVTDALRGKRILFTGATGFVGKVALSMLLTRFPEIGKVFVLARPGVSTSAEDRFHGKVVVAPPFDPLRARLGGDFEAFLREKCEAIPGDVSKKWCGFPEELLARLTGQVDVLVNSAGLVDFNPTLEAAINANALGAIHVAETASRIGARLVHVSTCFVWGNVSGIHPEDEDLLGYFPKRDDWHGQAFDPFVEVEDCRKVIERIKAEAEDKARQSEFRAKAIDRLHAEGRDDGDEKAVRTGAMRERKLHVTEKLIRAGLGRAQHWGWPNTYTYTKSLGDQLIDGIARREGLEFSIVRPAVVESSLRFPFPGWNEGFTTTAPLTFLAIKGHRSYPGRPGLVLDVIPCDLIAAGLIAVTAALLEGTARKVYQLGTSDSNPLRVERTIEMTGLYRRRYYLRKAEEEDRLKNELLARIEPQTVDRDRYLQLSAPQVADLARRAGVLLDAVKPSWGAPRIAGAIERVQDELAEVRRKANLAQSMFEMFLPFIWENRYIFQSKHVRELYARIPDDDRARIPWDPEQLDWLRYWLDVHLPGLEKWVYPNLEDELGGGGRKKGVPVYRDLWELLEARSRRHAGKVALRWLREGAAPERWTYGQLRDRAVRAAFYLAACGVKREDRVLLVSENRPEWVMAYFGVVKAGATAVPMDHQASAAEIENVVRASGATAVIVSDRVRARLGLNGVLGDARAVGLDDLFAARVPDVEEGALAPREPADLASLIFTSGTTGKPKGVMLTQRNFTSLVSRISGVFDLGERDGLLSVLPLHHTFEFTAGLLMPLACGAEIAYLEELSGDALAGAFETGRVTAMVGVPALWQLLLRRIEGQLADAGLDGAARSLQNALARAGDAGPSRPGEGDRQGARFPAGAAALGKALFFPVHRRLGGRMRFLISGGSAMPPDVYNAFKGMGFTIYEGYGLTEAAPVLTVQGPGNARAGHVGKPLPGVEVRIRAPDESGVGEVIARGPNVMAGYFRDPEATAEVLREGWLHTGDLGRLDEDGNLVIVGRQKDVIIDANGKNVHPDELEELYRDSPYVKELSVVGLPDEGGGEKVACLVVPDVSKGTFAEIVPHIEAHLRDVSLKLPFYKRLKVVHFTGADLPRTATRKVKRNQVVEELARLERQVKGGGGKKALLPEADAWLYDLVARVCEKPREQVVPEARLEADLGFDSLMFTELGVELERAGVKLPAPEEVMSIATVGELARQVGVWRRGGSTRAQTGDPGRTAAVRRAPPKGGLLGALLDAVQPALDEVPVIASALALARVETERLVPESPVRKVARKAQEVVSEPRALDLPDTLVGAGRRALRAGQRGLYEVLLDSRVYGRAHVPQHVNFLVAANHASHLDMGLVKHALGEQGDRLVALAARDYFFEGRWRRTYFENFTNLIPMDRTGSLRESLALAGRSLAQGKNLLIFPEGTRAVDGSIKEFKPSIGYLALTSRVGVLPVYLEGTHEVLPKGTTIPRGREVAAHVGPLLSYEELVERTRGMSRSEQHREVARLVEDAVRALAERRRRRGDRPPGPAPRRPARVTLEVPRSDPPPRPRRNRRPGEAP